MSFAVSMNKLEVDVDIPVQIIPLNLGEFLREYNVYSIMEYKNNDPFENDGSALIIFVTAIAIAVSLLGIIVCIKVTNL